MRCLRMLFGAGLIAFALFLEPGDYVGVQSSGTPSLRSLQKVNEIRGRQDLQFSDDSRRPRLMK